MANDSLLAHEGIPVRPIRNDEDENHSFLAAMETLAMDLGSAPTTDDEWEPTPI